MKAIVLREFGGPEVLKLEDFPEPEPGPGEVVVEVHAVSVNRTLDLALRSGKYAKPVKFPHILGVDPSGVVVRLGDGVTERKVGDRVVTLPWRVKPEAPSSSVGVEFPGGYAQYVKLPAAATKLVPAGVDFPTATIVGRHIGAAYTLLRDAAAAKAGEWVLIMGASGGLGAAGIQVAKLLGCRVIAAAGADTRVDAARQLGADAGVNYRTQDLTQEVLRLTAGQGANIVFENIGDPVLFPKAFMALARRGRLVTSGGHGGGQVQFDVNRLYQYQLSILGRVGMNPADVDVGLQAAAEGRFKVLIDRVLPLSAAAEAHRLVDSRAGVGKVLLDPTRLT